MASMTTPFNIVLKKNQGNADAPNRALVAGDNDSSREEELDDVNIAGMSENLVTN